jgi:acetolactate synthase small subunit
MNIWAFSEVLEIKASGADVRVSAQVGGNGFNGPSHFTFRIEHNHVSRMTIRA